LKSHLGFLNNPIKKYSEIIHFTFSAVVTFDGLYALYLIKHTVNNLILFHQTKSAMTIFWPTANLLNFQASIVLQILILLIGII